MVIRKIDDRHRDDKVEHLVIPYLAYLRHQGFPSPLLDWTRSPYVAAFFAFRHPHIKEHFASCHPYVEGRAAIYVYLEFATGGKVGSTSRPEIRGITRDYVTRRRHFLQQSEYTVCFVGSDEDTRFGSHEEVLKENWDDQDLFWKFTIPHSERKKALQDLSRMNINAYSLFGSEDSLCEELATREFVLGEK